MPKTRIDDENVQHTGELIVLASKFKVVDDTDHSKVAKFVCSSITAGQVSEITIPDADGSAVYLTATQTLTNKTLDDTTTVFADTDGPTKKARLELSGVTAGQTRVLTVPDYNATLATLAGTETFTAKTLTSPSLTAQATDAIIGAVAAPPAGTTAVTIARVGNFFTLTFTLTGAQIAVTDAGAAGAYGSTKLFDFAEGGISFLGCRQNYTAYTPDGTGVPTDDQFVIGLGTTAISAAADAVLAAGEQNVGASIAQTLVAGTTTGTAYTAANSAFDGSGTAADLYLNWSGDDVTTDGNGTINVTGTITVIGVFLGDD